MPITRPNGPMVRQGNGWPVGPYPWSLPSTFRRALPWARRIAAPLGHLASADAEQKRAMQLPSMPTTFHLPTFVVAIFSVVT